MDFLKINENKLKITLTAEDLEEWDMDAEELDYGSPQTRALLQDLLRRADLAVGFPTERARVLVQLYSSRDGSCEMFVSRIGVASAEEGGSSPLLHCKPSHRSAGGVAGAFGFDRLEWLLCVCRRLRGIGYGRNSAVYRGDDRRYYLFLEGLDPLGYLNPDEYSFISEYGSVESVSAMRQFLREHGTPICTENAVERLGLL
ncbi:MAG: adaptor protein MecA [Clostridia bacterium]|nr:adaptor protein MecA [Clostridia bacterium]